MERDSPKVNVFCAVSRRRVFDPFFFAEKTVTGFPLGFRQGQCLVPPLPKTLPELRRRISSAIENVTEGMLERVWLEWEYRLDIAASHVVRTSNAFNVITKLQTFFF
jgi:hypothetical protein